MIKQKINTVLFVIFATCCYFLLPVIAIINFPQYFWWRFEVYNVYQNFQINNKLLLQSKFELVLNYMNLRFVNLDANFFSKEDLIHMHDVQIIMAVVFLIIILSVILFIINLLNESLRKNWLVNSKYSLVAFIIILLVTGLPFLINFDGSFILFHQILFRNQYWALDPSTSNLIKYLPEVIFREILIIILLSSACLAVLNYILALFLHRFKLKLSENGK
jgi:integral membrane protein (TIGR01906 family)